MKPLPKDRVVWISGASSGIGRAAALAFARDGARVALASRKEEELRKLQQEIKAAGGTAIVSPCDMRQRRSVEASIGRTVKELGDLHVLVNNAGFGAYGPLETLADQDLEDIFRTNVFGPIYAIQFGLKFLRETKAGQIINITSVFARSFIPYMGAYCATKHALHALTRSLRVELRDAHVRVIEIAPGLTDTGFQKNARLQGMGAKPVVESKNGASSESVARVILKASKGNTREKWLTISGNAFIWFEDSFPRIADWGLHKWGRSVRGGKS